MKQIEATALRALLRKDNWAALADVVDTQVFTGMPARKLFVIMGDLHEVTEADLTFGAMSDSIEAKFQLKLNLRDELMGEWGQVRDAPDSDPTTLRHTITVMVQKAKAYEAAQYVATHIDDADFDPSVPAHMFDEASEMTTSMEATVADYATAPAPGMEDRNGLVKIGIHPHMDRAIGGGVANGETLVLLAPSGVGKTSTLCWIGAQMAKVGEHVLHISCEDHKHKVFGRYDSSLTELDKCGLVKHPARVMAARHALPGKVSVQDWSSRSVKASMMRSLVMRMRANGQPVTAVMLDYLGKMEPDSKIFDGFRPFGKVTQEVRRVASELNFKLVTGWQTNKGGFSANILSVDDVADDIGVYRETDHMWGINQTIEQGKNHRATFNVIKTRDGTYKPTVICHADFDRMVIRPTELDSQEEPDVGTYSAD